MSSLIGLVFQLALVYGKLMAIWQTGLMHNAVHSYQAS